MVTTKTAGSSQDKDLVKGTMPLRNNGLNKLPKPVIVVIQ